MKQFNKILILLLVTGFIAIRSNAQLTPATDPKIIITNFKVYENNDQLFIDWQTDGVVEANYWQVQRSVDGKTFTTIAIVLGPDPRQGTNRYQYKTKMRKRGESNMIYRLNPVDIREKEINTEIVSTTK